MRPSEYYDELRRQKYLRDTMPRKAGIILRGTTISLSLGLLSSNSQETPEYVAPVFKSHLRG